MAHVEGDRSASSSAQSTVSHGIRESDGATVGQQAETWFARLRAGHAADRQAFEAWFAADVAHADAYERLLDSWERTEILADAAADERRVVAPTNRWQARRLLAIAASVLILVGVGSIVTRLFDRAPLNATPFRIESAGDAARHVGLGDGSRLVLAPNTIVDAQFSGDVRRVRILRGHARFTVMRDAQRPFVVDTPAGSVTATGTEFDVAVEAGRAIVALFDGSLAIRCLDTAAPPLILQAGRRVTITRLGPVAPPVPLSVLNTGRSDSMLSFENVRLSAVVAAINRSGGPKIVLVDAESQGVRFTGSLRSNDTAGVARLLAQTFGLRLSTGRSADIYLSS